MNVLMLETSFDPRAQALGLDDGIRRYLSECNLAVAAEAPLAFIVVVNRTRKDGDSCDSRPVNFGSKLRLFEQEYSLCGTINHHCSATSKSGGHYTANVVRAINPRAWIHCNDTVCASIDLKEVLDERARREVDLLLYEEETFDSTLDDFANVMIQQISMTQELDEAVIFLDEELVGNIIEDLSNNQLLLQLKVRELPTDGPRSTQSTMERRLRLYLATSYYKLKKNWISILR
jgi:hypothetical protein